MSDPTIAQRAPFPVQVEEGRNYFWCSCGKSSKQPFCDGSHSGTKFSPLPTKADAAGKKFFCGCKMTKNPPYCDGTHSKLD